MSKQSNKSKQKKLQKASAGASGKTTVRVIHGDDRAEEQPKATTKVVKTEDKKTIKADKKAAKAVAKAEKKANKKPMSKPVRVVTWPFRMIAKPFIALGRYIHDSWLELRQVRWPNRKATWQMVFAIAVYVAILIVVITLLDAFFTFIFNTVLGQ